MTARYSATPAGPQPVVVRTVCSECGLDWDGHGDKPTFADCIRLLKAEVAKPRVAYPGTATITGISGTGFVTTPTIAANTGWGYAGGVGNPNPPHLGGAPVPRKPRPKAPAGGAQVA